MFVDDNPGATIEDILAHHGVKGMHWGVRKASGGAEGGAPAKGGAPTKGSAPAKVGSKLRGTRPDASGVTRQQLHQTRKVQNRTASRNLEDWHEDTPRKQRNEDIKAARKAWKSVNRNYKDTKHDIKAQVKTGQMGKFAAKAALNKVANERGTVYIKSRQHTTGEAVTHAVLGALGAAAGH